MGVQIQALCAVALLQSCSLVSDFDFRESDGGTPADGSVADAPTDSDSTDVFVPDAPSSPLELTNLVLVADGEAVSFDTPFDPSGYAYESEVGFFVREVTVTATTEAVGATLTLDGVDIASGVPTPVELAFGDNALEVVLTRGAEAPVTYTLDLDRGDSLDGANYLKSDPVMVRANFGGAVAMAGDLLVIGAQLEPRIGLARVGAVYIFARSGSGWIQSARVEGPLQSDAFFGASVATDGVSIAVGAPGEAGDPGLNIGAVYVFRNDMGWVSERVEPTSSLAGDQFGFSVAIEDNRLAVGAAGRSFVFTFTTSGAIWSPRNVMVPPPGASEGSRFGSALVMRGNTLVIAADGEDSGVAEGIGGVDPVIDGTLSESGAVYVYERDGSDWINPISFKAFGPQASDRFGSAIAFDGDLLAVGAAGEDSSTEGVQSVDASDSDRSDSGAAYTFRRDAAGVWGRESYFKSEVPENFAGYGSSLALWGNLLVVGSPDAAGAEVRSGLTSHYVRSGGSWRYISNLQPETDAGSDDAFGASIGISRFGIVVGAPNEDGDGTTPSDDGASSAGAAYSFSP